MRLRELVIASKELAPVVALATFSQRLRAGQSPAEQVEASSTHAYYMPHMSTEGLLRGFAEYNRVIREVAFETHNVLVEGEESIPGDDRYFADSVHFTDLGAALMADRVTAALISSPELQKEVRETSQGATRTTPGSAPTPEHSRENRVVVGEFPSRDQGEVPLKAKAFERYDAY
jgi:hypothetical protein